MEGLKRSIIQFKKIVHHPHLCIFCIILLFNTLMNGVMISHMGISTFIDSFVHPNEYTLLNQNQINQESQKNRHFAIIIQKISQPYVQQNKTICLNCNQSNIRHMHKLSPINTTYTQGYYQVIEEKIAYIPKNPLTIIACLWWQKTNDIIEKVKK